MPQLGGEVPPTSLELDTQLGGEVPPTLLEFCSTVGGLVPKGGLIRVICVEGQLDS